MINIRRQRPILTLLLAALLAPAATAASAQEVSQGESGAAESQAEGSADPNTTARRPLPPETVKVEGVLPYIPTSNTITTRLPLPLRLTPANVGTVNEALLREQYDLTLGDALTNVSGLNVQTVADVVDFFTIRGFDSLNSALVLTDGAPEPEVTFYQMYNVERVEVLKGPGGFLYGSNAMAGAVNIVRRQPVPGTFGRVAANAGSFGTYEGAVDFNKASPDGRHAFRLNSVWRQSDSYRDDKENTILAVNPAFTWRVGDRSSLNINLEYVESEYEPDSGLPIFGNEVADVPRTRSYQSPFDRSDQQIGRVQIDLETKLSDAWTLRNKTYGRDLDWLSEGTLFNGVVASLAGPEVSRTLVLLDDRQITFGNRLEAVVSAATGAVKHEVLAGLEATRFGDDFELDVAFLPNIDLDDPMETAQKPLPFIPGQSAAGDSRSIVLAPYIIDQITISDRFHALAGARLDMIDFEDEVSSTAREDSEISPFGGIVFARSAAMSYYAGAGRAFSPPSSRIAGDREPEESLQYEVGAKIERPGGKVQATVAAYHMERENIAIPDDNGFTQQAGDQRSRGIELEVAAQPWPRLRTFLSYAYTDAELTRFSEQVIVGVDPNTFQPIFATVDRSGNTPAFAPDHILNLWVSKMFEGGFGLAGGGRYVSDQFIAEDNAFEIDGYVIFNAAFFYTRGDWDLRLNLKNLTSRKYEMRGFGSTSVIPAPTFSAYGGIQYRF